MRLLKFTISLVLIITTMVLTLAPISALSFGYKWSNTPRTVLSKCNMDSTGRTQVQAAMNRWNNILVDGHTPVYMLLTNNSSANSVDYRDAFESWVAYCTTSHSPTEIYNVNIDLNTLWYDFSSGAVEGCYDSIYW